MLSATAIACGALYCGLDRNLFAQSRDLAQQVGHRPLEAGDRGVRVACVDAAGQRQNLLLQHVETFGAGSGGASHPVELVGEVVQHAVDRGEVAAGNHRPAQGLAEILEAADQVADRIDADPLDLVGEGVDPHDDLVRMAAAADGAAFAQRVELGAHRLDLLLDPTRRRGPQAEADLFEQRPQLGHVGSVTADAALQFCDLGADRLEPLGEALDPLRPGERADQAADFVQFAEQVTEFVTVGEARRAAAERPVHLRREALDVAGDAGMDVLRHIVGETGDLNADQFDGGRDGGEIGGLLRALDPGDEGVHRLFEGTDVAARGEAGDRFAKTARLGLQFGERRRRRPCRRGGRLLLGSGRVGIEFALTLADFRHRVAQLHLDRAAAPADGARRGQLLAEFDHAALDLRQTLGHLCRRGQAGIQHRADPGFDLLDRPRRRLLRDLVILGDLMIDLVETPHHLGDGGGEGRDRVRCRSRDDGGRDDVSAVGDDGLRGVDGCGIGLGGCEIGLDG